MSTNRKPPTRFDEDSNQFDLTPLNNDENQNTSGLQPSLFSFSWFSSLFSSASTKKAPSSSKKPTLAFRVVEDDPLQIQENNVGKKCM